MTPAISPSDLPLILPLIILTVSTLVVMFQTAVRRHHATAALLTVLGLLAALASVFAVMASPQYQGPHLITPLLQLDGWVLYGWLLLLLVALGVSGLCWLYWRDSARPMEELYILLLCASLGACVLIASRHFAALFLGLELMSIALIAMLGYPLASEGDQKRPLEAALKYLVLSAVSSAVMLFGLALLYAETGSMDFAAVAGHLTLAEPQGLYLLMGTVLLVIGLGFKLSLVPFHLWTPDVYEGAPLPVVALLATLSKGAVLALLLRYASLAQLHLYPAIITGIGLLAVASMLIGNLLALMQDNPKRLLAYSSIAHMGYVLIAVLLSSSWAIEAAGLYLAAYLLMTLGAFAALSILSAPQQEPQKLEDLRGLLWRQPVAGLTLIVMLLSLAGIPLTIGFVGKFYLVAAAVQGGFWLLISALIIGSVIGLFYYLRFVVVLIQAEAAPQAVKHCNLVGNTLLFGCVALVLLLGVSPGSLLAILRNIAASGF